MFAELSRRLGGRLLSHAPLAGGVSSRVIRVYLEMPGGELRRVVVREPGVAEWKEGSPESSRREFDLLGYLSEQGFPVPTPVLCVADFYVMDFVEGTQEMPADGIEKLADLLARLHSLPVDDAPPLPERENPIAGLPAFLGPRHEALRTRLAERPPKLSPRRTLLHGDFWPGNVLWRDGEVAALLDWEDAATGDPLSDVATCRLELRYDHGKKGAEAFTRRYADRTYLPLDELPIWDAYVAAAALAFMSQWGLPQAREAHMRREAEATLTEVEALLR